MSEKYWKLTKSGGGECIGFLNLLGLIFITLKLAGIGTVAGWSWWAVLSPFWVPIAFTIFLILFLATIGLLIDKKWIKNVK